VQYVDWMRGLFTGDLGRSAITKQPLTEALRDRIPVTLQLAVASFIISMLIAIPAGIISAYKRNSLLDRVITVVALMGVAMPSFWLGILLILFFAVELRWFPPSGFVSFTTDPIECLRYIALPAISLGAVQAAVIMRQMRSSLLEVLNEDYVRTARAKGLRERQVVLVHGMRNALLPVVTVVGLQVGRVLGGSVIIETVFAMPGMGRYAVNAIFDRDYPVVQATVLIRRSSWYSRIWQPTCYTESWTRGSSSDDRRQHFRRGGTGDPSGAASAAGGGRPSPADPGPFHLRDDRDPGAARGHRDTGAADRAVRPFGDQRLQCGEGADACALGGHGRERT